MSANNKWAEPGKEKIRFCPFCASLRVDICRTNKNACWVECSDCGARTQSHKHRESAIALWNTRAVNYPLADILDDDEKRTA